MNSYGKNMSVSYLLITSFDYEIRNYIDIHIARLTGTDLQEDLTEEDAAEVQRLKAAREYLLQRIGELK